MAKRKFALGWTRDRFDARDFKYKVTARVKLPKSVDLRSSMPVVYDQGDVNSCTAHAIGAAWAYEHIKNGLPAIMPSRLFIYYNERVIEHSVKQDDGAQIRDGIKSLNKLGVCAESDWAYNTAAVTKKPNKKAYSDALQNVITAYQAVNQNDYDVKAVLAKNFPVVFGIDVYSSFMSDAVAKNGIVPMPSHTDSLEGGHAVLIVGYDDDTKNFIVRNSWGTGWGDAGYFYLPYEYVLSTKLSSDFWLIQK